MLYWIICETTKVLKCEMYFNMLTQRENWLNVSLKQSETVKTNSFDGVAKTKPLLHEFAKLPLNSKVIKDARFLNPINRNSKNALNGISCLVLTFGKLLKTSLPVVFNLKVVV